MAFDPALQTLSGAVRTLLNQTTAQDLRRTGLGIDPDIDALLVMADVSAMLTGLGFSSFVKTLIDDNDAATARATLGALGNYLHVNKTNADTPYTASANEFVECSTAGGALTVTLPAFASVNAGDRIAVGLRTAGNTLMVDGNGSETINGAANDTMSVTGQFRIYECNAAKTDWIIT